MTPETWVGCVTLVTVLLALFLSLAMISED